MPQNNYDIIIRINTVKLLYKFEKLTKELGKIFYVVMGGIAIDGYAGRLTREHPDVDLLIFRKDLEPVEKVLEKLGYKHIRYKHPSNPGLEYKMQTGKGKNHIFSFQILDKVGEHSFKISFYRDANIEFPVKFIKPQHWLELESVKFPAVSKKF